jgi:hypothetical protein
MPYALAEKWLKIERDKLYANRKYSKAEKISPYRRSLKCSFPRFQRDLRSALLRTCSKILRLRP